MTKISVVINTFNEAKHIERVLKSVKWADEIIVCDMHSDDDTVKLAKEFGAKIIFHKRLSYVEPARNFAISKTRNEWVLVLDPDEEVSEELVEKLKEVVNSEGMITYIEIPRKNIIFGKWINTSMWWPDYNIRCFKKGGMIWSNKIHSKPEVKGQGSVLPSEEKYAIIHHHYTSIGQYLTRMDRYTSVEAGDLINSGYELKWQDMLNKPIGEFLSRYFANRGFQDGLHGLSLSLLQSFSFFIVYLKVWEEQKFKEQVINFNDFNNETKHLGKEFNYWLKYGNLSNDPIKRFVQKIKNKIS